MANVRRSACSIKLSIWRGLWLLGPREWRGLVYGSQPVLTPLGYSIVQSEVLGKMAGGRSERGKIDLIPHPHWWPEAEGSDLPRCHRQHLGSRRASEKAILSESVVGFQVEQKRRLEFQPCGTVAGNPGALACLACLSLSFPIC